jgi:hypothetical protein
MECEEPVVIIQEVLKGIPGIDSDDARRVLRGGIQCNWFRNRGVIDINDIPDKLTERNLDWHQNRYDWPDPLVGNQNFSLHTPFISTTAGSVERDTANDTNILNQAWMEAVYWATQNFTVDGYIFYCFVWVVGKHTVEHQALSEELRELNIYTGFSPFQPEGEIAAKILIPPAQVQRAEFWSATDAYDAIQSGIMPASDPAMTLINPLFSDPSRYNNVRQAI